MNDVFAEFLGTMILVLLGNGVVANVVLRGTKGHSGGWIVITAGWGLAVYVAVVCTEQFSGAHLNPAVTLGLAVSGKFLWSRVAAYVIAQFAGGLCGGALVYAFYHQHYQLTEDRGAKLGTFCTAPAIRSTLPNLFCEIVGTFILVFTVLLFAPAQVTLPNEAGLAAVGLGAVGALPVALLVTSIGLSLGGTTGYAINPARDLGPRIAHALLPIPNKGDSDWSYAWIPVVGPLLGGALAAFVYQFVA
ncbi:MAG: aquaporin family protein [Planctomycetales bacterium]|nr:aquaporin family protein [Planctomycetales bacterium]